MPTKDKQATILRPTSALGSDGQPRGQDAVIRADVPCSFDPLTGLESDVAGQLTAVTNYSVKLYGDPNRKITTRDYLTLGDRRFNIQSIDDPSLHQLRELTLVCGERT